MIYYNPMSEVWVDTKDPDFEVAMTPEGPKEEYEKEFNTQVEFYKWYNSPQK